MEQQNPSLSDLEGLLKVTWSSVLNLCFPGRVLPSGMRDKPVGRVLGLHPLLLVQLCFRLFIDCASRHGFIRNTEILPQKTTEGLEITDSFQLPRQYPQAITDEERGPQGLGADLTKATEGRVTLDPGLPRARSADHTDQ